MTGTMIEMNAPADSRCQAVPRVPLRLARATVIGATSVPPPAKVRATSRSFQTQRNWKMPNAASAGRQQWQQHLEEDRHVAGAVHPGRLEERRRDLPHEVVQQEDRQRQREDRVRQPDRPERAGQPGLDVEVSSGIRVTCIGTICRAKTTRNRKLLPGKLIQANAYAASSARQIGMITEGIVITNELTKNEPSWVSPRQHGPVVVQRDHGVAEERPPARRLDRALGPERRDQQAEGGQRPQHREDHRRQRGPRRGELLLGRVAALDSLRDRRRRRGAAGAERPGAVVVIVPPRRGAGGCCRRRWG